MDNDYHVVELDEELFLSVSKEYETIEENLNDARGYANDSFSFLTGELSSSINRGSAIEKIDKAKEDALVLSTMIKNAVEMYKNVENDTLLQLGMFDSEIYKMFAEDNAKREKVTLEERIEFLDNLLVNWQKDLSELQDEFNKLYKKGIAINPDNLTALSDVFNLFRIYKKSIFSNELSFYTDASIEKDFTYLDCDNVVELIKFCNENEVIEKITEYMNGASWKDSGLEEFYNGEEFNEEILLADLRYSGSLLADEIKDSKSLREWLKSTSEGWNSAYSELSEKGTDYSIRSYDIAKLSQIIYELKEVKGLLPYQELMSTVDLSKYKEKDWENYKLIDRRNLEYMSLEEAALYDYLYETEGKEGANKYILAMEDTINRREAAKNAIEYLDGLAVNGFDLTDTFASAWDGTIEGLNTFFDGLKNFFVADGKKSVGDYERLYKTMFLLQGSEEYGIDYSEVFTDLERDFLNWNHQLWSSVGNMMIPSLVGFIPVVGKYAASGLMFMSIAGNSTESALQEGYGNIQSRFYGLLTGLSEVVTERLLGGIPGLSDLDDIPNGASKTLLGKLKDFMSGTKVFVGNMTKEAREEFIQEYIGAGIENFVLSKNTDLFSPELFGEAMYSASIGFASSGVHQGGKVLGNTLTNVAINETMGSLFNNISNPTVKNIALAELSYLFNRNGSDENAVSAVINAFRNINTPESLNTLKGLIKLANNYGVRVTNSDLKVSHWNRINHIINIDSESLDSLETILHEIHHAEFDLFVLLQPLNNLTTIEGEGEDTQYFLKDQENMFAKARIECSNGNWKKIRAEQLENITSTLKKNREEVKRERSGNGNNTLDEHAKLEIGKEALRRTFFDLRENTEIPPFQDILCAVSTGILASTLIFKHPRKYYENNPENQIHETMANVGSAIDRHVTTLFDAITSAFGPEFCEYIKNLNERVSQHNEVLGNVVPMDVEELTVFELVDSLESESSKQKSYFAEYEYEKLSEDAKKRYDFASSLEKRGITRYRLLIGEWKKMDFSNMSKEEASFLLNLNLSRDIDNDVRSLLELDNPNLLNTLENIGN